MTDREQIRRDAADIERDVVTVRGFVDYPTASGRDVYLRAVEALDRLALDAHRAEQAERERDEEKGEHGRQLAAARRWHDRALQAERERDEANTRLHSLRWLLGLDTHKGEDPQPRDEAHHNLDALLDQR